jgi:hypothetical protein
MGWHLGSFSTNKAEILWCLLVPEIMHGMAPGVLLLNKAGILWCPLVPEIMYGIAPELFLH